MASTPLEQAIESVVFQFPEIDRNALKITSPVTPKYNCIAYAAGDMRRWWWPDPLGIGYWPSNAPRSETLPAFQCAFRSLGYEACANSDLEEGIEKVAFFHKNGATTHACIQLINGLWSSKLGIGFDISHDLRGLEGINYGVVGLIMSRPRRT